MNRYTYTANQPQRVLQTLGCYNSALTVFVTVHLVEGLCVPTEVRPVPSHIRSTGHKGGEGEGFAVDHDDVEWMKGKNEN